MDFGGFPIAPETARLLKEGGVALYLVSARGLVAPGVTADQRIMGGVLGASPSAAVRQLPAAPSVNTREMLELQALAESTGGQAVFDTNDLEGSIENAIRDTELTYTLGFYPTGKAMNGMFHPLRVKVLRKGVEVRHRDGYYAPSAKTTPEQASDLTLDELIADPLDATAVGLTAAVRRSDASPDESVVQIAVDLRDLLLTPDGGRRRGSLDLAVYPEASKEGIKHWTVTVDLSEEEYRTASVIPYAVPLWFPPSGRLRAVVRDQATGAAGSLWLVLKKPQ